MAALLRIIMLPAGDQGVPAVVLYAYLLLFVTVVVEGPAATVAAGVLVALRRLDWRIALPLIVVADLLGAHGYYGLGFYGRHPLLARVRRALGLSDRRLAPFERSFERHGGLLLLGAKWLQFMSMPTVVAAGLLRVPYRRFLWYSLLGTVPKSVLLLLLGVMFGSRAVLVMRQYVAIGSVVSLVAVGLIILLILALVPSLLARRLKREQGQDEHRGGR